MIDLSSDKILILSRKISTESTLVSIGITSGSFAGCLISTLSLVRKSSLGISCTEDYRKFFTIVITTKSSHKASRMKFFRLHIRSHLASLKLAFEDSDIQLL